ncbi:MAG TPA: glutamine amidotransferase [Pirellulales bacterium]|nr:glutamine amidotransferase [Pirellulales bacterium]
MFEWSRPYPVWAYFLLAVALLGLIAAARRLAISDRLRSWTLFVPRLVVLALLLWVLLNPVRRQEHRLPSLPPQVHYLLDASRSMGLETPLSRATRVQQAIRETERKLPSSKHPRLQMYRFGSNFAVLADLTQFSATEDSTLLAESLERLPARFSRDPPRAVVVFSDGAVDDQPQLDQAARLFAERSVPVHVYPIGDPHVRGDVGIDDLVIPPHVEAGAKATIRGVVRGTGYAGERIVLSLRPADQPQAAPLASLPMTLGEQPQSFEMVVEANSEVGDLVLEAPPLAGEATDRNNRIAFQLASNRRKLRVIYMEGTGGTEYQWVRNALQEDKNVECLAMVADQQYVQRPRLVRVDDVQRGFPTTSEELFGYDVVICSDISRGAFTKEQLDWVVELVAERGGGFAMVGGITSFGAGGWDQTVWDKLIPVDMQGGNLGRGWLYQNFHVRVPDEALSHPIWRITEDPDQNRKIIARMPLFYGTNYIERLKPAATALAYSAETLQNIGRSMPIFAAQSYGRGRTFAFSPDTTADWGRDFEKLWGEGDNRYFRRFWRNLVRWLGENSVNGNRRLQVETDRVIYRAGQPIVVTARAWNDKDEETVAYSLRAEVKLPPSAAASPAAAPVPLVVNAIGKSYRAELDSHVLAEAIDPAAQDSAALAARTIDVIATHEGKEIGRASAKVQIVPDLHELTRPQSRPETLAQLARLTGGKVLNSPAELTEVLTQLPETKGDSLISRQPLWDKPWLLLVILGLLSLEWTLRRLTGYA